MIISRNLLRIHLLRDCVTLLLPRQDDFNISFITVDITFQSKHTDDESVLQFTFSRLRIVENVSVLTSLTRVSVSVEDRCLCICGGQVPSLVHSRLSPPPRLYMDTTLITQPRIRRSLQLLHKHFLIATE